MANQLLEDTELERQLQENGYVVVPFLDAEELDALRDFYQGIHPNDELPTWIENIHMTSWCHDLNYKLEVKKRTAEITKSSAERFFHRCRFLNHVFIVKKSGKATVFKVHQDWNVVDESKYRSVNIWIPLWDVNAKSGALWILPGSHRINRPIRGAGYLFPDYGEHLAILEKFAVSVDLTAGQAVIFYHSVIHGSPPNLVNRNRAALAFSALPVEAPLCIYFQKSVGAPLEQHAPADDFMYLYQSLRTETLERPPTEKPVHIHPSYKNPPVTEKEIKDFINSSVLKSHKPWWNFWG